MTMILTTRAHHRVALNLPLMGWRRIVMMTRRSLWIARTRTLPPSWQIRWRLVAKVWTLMMKRALMATIAVRAVPVIARVTPRMMKMNLKRSWWAARASLWVQWTQMLDLTGGLLHPPNRPNQASWRPMTSPHLPPMIHQRMKVMTMMPIAASKVVTKPERRLLPRGRKRRRLREGKQPLPMALLTKLLKRPQTLNVLLRVVPTVLKFGLSTWHFICRLLILIAHAMSPTVLLNELNSAKKERSSMSGQHCLHWSSSMEPTNPCTTLLIVPVNKIIPSKSIYACVSFWTRKLMPRH
mmetsp:Transcript_5873/g.13386  ORF Transcript_5873/g.13386 Transcript_5873/m.13386 type:complete len:296 (-) Transcript_5873:591-1478(-)